MLRIFSQTTNQSVDKQIEQYGNFLEYLHRKHQTQEKENFSYLVGAKMKTIYLAAKEAQTESSLPSYNLLAGSVEVNAISYYWQTATHAEKLKSIPDPTGVFENFKRIHQFYHTKEKRNVRATDYLETEYQAVFKKMKPEAVLVFMVEAFFVLIDQKKLIWRKFQVETLFS